MGLCSCGRTLRALRPVSISARVVVLRARPTTTGRPTSATRQLLTAPRSETVVEEDRKRFLDALDGRGQRNIRALRRRFRCDRRDDCWRCLAETGRVGLPRVSLRPRQLTRARRMNSLGEAQGVTIRRRGRPSGLRSRESLGRAQGQADARGTARELTARTAAQGLGPRNARDGRSSVADARYSATPGDSKEDARGGAVTISKKFTFR